MEGIEEPEQLNRRNTLLPTRPIGGGLLQRRQAAVRAEQPQEVAIPNTFFGRLRAGFQEQQRQRFDQPTQAPEEIQQSQLPAIPDEGLPFTETIDGEEIDLVLMPDYTITFEGKSVGRYNIQTNEFEPTEQNFFEKIGIGLLGAVEKAFVPFTFVGAGIHHLGKEFEKRAGMSQEEWELYKKSGLPISSLGDFRKLLPGGELYEEFQDLPIGNQLLLELPVAFAAGKITATALRSAVAKQAAQKGAAGIAARGIRGAAAPLAFIESIPGLAVRGTGKLLKGAAKPLIRAAERSPVKGVRAATAEIETSVNKLTTIFKQFKPQRKVLTGEIQATRRQQAIDLNIVEDRWVNGSIKYEDYLAQKSAILSRSTARPEVPFVGEAGFTVDDVAVLERQVITSPFFEGKPLARSGFGKAFQEILGFAKGADGKLKPPRIPTQGELDTIQQVFGIELRSAIQGKSARGAKAWAEFVDIINIPRAVKASWDASGILRQNIMLMLEDPRLGARKAVRSIRALFDGKDFEAQQKMLKSHPDFNFAVETMGMEFLETGAANAARKAEGFMSRYTRFIPGIKQSERAMVSISNDMRFGTAFNYKQMFGNTLTDEQYRQLGTVIQAFGGRGTLGRRLNSLAPLLNGFLFSPRFQVGLAQSVALPIINITNPAIRRLAMRSWTRFIGLNVGLIAMGQQAGLWNVELDPRSSNFGRMRIGNTRVDLWSGYLPWLRLYTRLATGETKTQSGIEMEINRWDTLIHTGRGKLSPFAAGIVDLLAGTNYIGEEIPDITDLQNLDTWEVIRNQMPLAMTDLFEAYQQDGLTGTYTAVPGIFGANVASYPDRLFDQWSEEMGIARGNDMTIDEMITVRDDFNNARASWLDYENTKGQKPKNLWRKAHPDVEATMYFWGRIRELSTPEARDSFNKTLEQYNFPATAFPMREFEPYDASGKTETETFNELITQLPSYLDDFVLNNKDQFDLRNIPALIATLETIRQEDQDLLDNYNLMTKGEDSRFRERFRRDNPDVDAALNFWGSVSTTKTREAQALLRLKAQRLGLPESVIPALSRKGATRRTSPLLK